MDTKELASRLQHIEEGWELAGGNALGDWYLDLINVNHELEEDNLEALIDEENHCSVRYVPFTN